VDVLQRQLDDAVKLIESRRDDQRPSFDEAVGCSRPEVHAPNSDLERRPKTDEKEAATTLRRRLGEVEEQLSNQVEMNGQLVEQLDACRADKVDVTKDLERERARTCELEKDVAHLQTELADATQLRGLETTNRLLRQDLERVESRLEAVQREKSQLRDACDQLEGTVRDLTLRLEAACSALTQNDGNVRNLEDTTRTLRAEVGDLKDSLTQADELAARTQTELVTVKSALQDELANAGRMQRALNDETAKRAKLEKTVVELYAELESKSSNLEREKTDGRSYRKQVETELRVSREENAKLKDLLRDAEK